jgi:hypothetical protein
MSKLFLTNIDLAKNQILNVALQNLATPPSNPVSGQIYYNTVDKVIYFWKITNIPNPGDGIWSNIGGGGISEVVAGTGLSGGGSTDIVTLNLNTDNVTIEVDSITDVVRIKDLGVTTQKLADNAVTTIKITDKNITFEKIQDIASMTVIGRVAAGSGIASEISIIDNLTSATTTTLATSQAIKLYVDNSLASIGNLEGGWNASTGSFPVGSTPTAGTFKGDYWYVTTAGTVGGVPFNVGDVIIAKIDNASTTDPNDWIQLEVNRDQATENILGLVKLATQLEVIEGVDNNKAVTSASIPNATTENRGFVTLATSGDTQTGISTDRVITPQGLSSRTATETRTGIAEIATQIETDNGTDDERIVTPLKLKTLLDNSVGGFTINIGNNINNSFAIEHGLNTKNIIVTIYDNNNDEEIYTDVFTTTNNIVTISFITPPTVNKYRVVIKK